MVYRDKSFHGQNLRIGRAPNQHVFLSDMRVSLQHAVITALMSGRFLIQSKSLSGIRVNDRLVQSFTIKQGDTITIGRSTLRLFEPPKGYDLALEVEPVKRTVPEDMPVPAALGGLGLHTRRLSWVLFSSVLFMFLALPAGSIYLYDQYSPYTDKVVEWLSTEEELYELPKMPLLVSDRFWNSGQFASAHYFFRNECDTCHQEAFQRVPDRACTNCHKTTAPHVDPEFFELDKLDNTRCAECHREHNGKHQLINRDDHLCSDCHLDLSRQGITTELGDAADFGRHHPDFKPTLRGHQEGAEVVKRVDMEDEENYQEESNLEFPHDVHLDKAGLATFDGIFRLWCEDCHTHKDGSPDMQSLEYESMCQDCHPLSFEPTEPERQVPHGKVSEVIYMLREYYGNIALQGGYPDSDVPEIVRQERFPDDELSAEELAVALDWARKKADETGEDVFEFSLCIECHKVRQTAQNPPRWDVVPVRFSKPWLPKAKFTHEKHKTMNCLFCHAAPESASSHDILVPGISVCRDCHGGVESPKKIQSTCVDCHRFHVAGDFSMRKRKR